MKVRRLITDGFRGLPDRSYSLIDPRSDSGFGLVLVTGSRSSGKTSFLEAIIAAKEQVGPYGAVQPPSSYLRAGETAAKIRVEWEISEAERARYGAPRRSIQTESIFGDAVVESPAPDPVIAALLGEYDPDPAFGKMEYFHATRRLPLGATIDLSKAPGDPLDRMSRLGRDDVKYSSLIRYIVEAGLGLDRGPDGSPKPPGRIKAAFDALCPTKTIGGLYKSGDALLPVFIDHSNKAYSLAQISDSELDSLLFAATFVRSGVQGSVVLIDTPERHLGDAETREFVHALSRLGDSNQLIVATRSEALLASVHSDQVIRLG
jgi:hypothetical protein